MDGLASYLAFMAGIFIVMTVVLIPVFWVLSLILERIASPKGQDLILLTSGYEGEAINDFRVANALIKGASPNFAFDFIFQSVGGSLLSLAFSTTLKVMGQMMNGVWVGGRVFLTTHRIVFMPNAINRAVTDGLEVVAIDLKRVVGVRERFGIITRIVDVETDAGTLSIRSRKAAAFAEAISVARPSRIAG